MIKDYLTKFTVIQTITAERQEKIMLIFLDL